jgi:hypothetical protein
VSPGSVKADGKSTATVTATVSDSGSPESGDDISFSSSDGGQSIGAVTDNGDGTYTATITASKTAGNATITARACGYRHHHAHLYSHDGIRIRNRLGYQLLGDCMSAVGGLRVYGFGVRDFERWAVDQHHRGNR